MSAVERPVLSELPITGLVFPESARWHDGRLWFVDMFAHRVYRADADLRGAELIAEFDDHTSGLGFLPDGVPIVVLKHHKHVVALDEAGQRVHADLSECDADNINDMVVDGQGRAYVDVITRAPKTPGKSARLTEGADYLVLVEPDGSHGVVATGLVRPNGLAITADGRTLVVAETPAYRVVTYSIDPSDGSLSDRQPFADLGEATADGLCLDAEGAVWVASPYTGQVLRVRRGGEVTHVIATEGKLPTACLLAGEDRRTLFVTTMGGTIADVGSDTTGFVESTVVDVPGAGRP